MLTDFVATCKTRCRAVAAIWSSEALVRELAATEHVAFHSFHFVLLISLFCSRKQRKSDKYNMYLDPWLLTDSRGTCKRRCRAVTTIWSSEALVREPCAKTSRRVESQSAMPPAACKEAATARGACATQPAIARLNGVARGSSLDSSPCATRFCM